MKRLISILLALCMMLSLLCGCAKRAEGENADAPIPYAWKEQRDGSYKFIITGETPEGYEWSASYEDTMVEIDEPVVKRNGSIYWKLTPISSGSTDISFTLTSLDVYRQDIYRIDIELMYDVEFTLTDNGYTEYDSLKTTGTATDYPLTYEKLADGRLVFFLKNSSQDEWECDPDGDFITVTEAIELDGYTAFVLQYGTARSYGTGATETDTSQEITTENAVALEITEETAVTTGTDIVYEPYVPTEEEEAASVEQEREAGVRFSLYSGNITYTVNLTYLSTDGLNIKKVTQGKYDKEAPVYAGSILTVDEETGGVYMTAEDGYQDRPEFEWESGSEEVIEITEDTEES